MEGKTEDGKQGRRKERKTGRRKKETESGLTNRTTQKEVPRKKRANVDRIENLISVVSVKTVRKR